jgi:hypothetical protein
MEPIPNGERGADWDSKASELRESYAWYWAALLVPISRGQYQGRPRSASPGVRSRPRVANGVRRGWAASISHIIDLGMAHSAMARACTAG